MKFKSWLESKEIDDIDALNMTRSLPFNSKTAANPLAHIGSLTRGFHLNTIVSRMLRPWVSTIELFQDRKERVAQRLLSQEQKIFGIDKKYIGEDGTLNSKFLAAFDLFKNELSNAVNDLPFKTGHDVVAGKSVDVLGPVKSYFSSYDSDGADFIQSLDKALKINILVFHGEFVKGENPPWLFEPTLVRNFINFLQIVRDEFITIGEQLPRMGDGSLERGNKELIKSIDQKINEYEKYYKGSR